MAGDAGRLGAAPPPPSLEPAADPADPESFEALVDEIMGPLAVLREPARVAAGAERLGAWPLEPRRAEAGERAALAGLRAVAAITILRAELPPLAHAGGKVNPLMRAWDHEEESECPRKPSRSP